MLAVRIPVAMAVTPPAGGGGTKAADADAQRAAVSADYAKVATNTGGCCVSSTPNRSAIQFSTSSRLAGS